MIQYQILKNNITRTVWQTVRRITNEILVVQGLPNCAPEIVNGIEKRGNKFLKHSKLNETIMNVNWDGNQNICVLL